MIEVTKVLSEVKKNPLWIERREMWAGLGAGDPDIEMHSLYSVVDGAYAGSADDAGMLKFFLSHVIKPQKRYPEANNCSIGFSVIEQKWYGWSHRAIFGFGKGSQVKRGDIGYRPVDRRDFKAECLRFWSDDHRTNITAHDDSAPGEDGGPDIAGVSVEWINSDDIPNEKMRGTKGGQFTPYPDAWGRGEWTAANLGDAKQMACDFAEGCS